MSKIRSDKFAEGLRGAPRGAAPRYPSPLGQPTSPTPRRDCGHRSRSPGAGGTPGLARPAPPPNALRGGSPDPAGVRGAPGAEPFPPLAPPAPLRSALTRGGSRGPAPRSELSAAPPLRLRPEVGPRRGGGAGMGGAGGERGEQRHPPLGRTFPAGAGLCRSSPLRPAAFRGDAARGSVGHTLWSLGAFLRVFRFC